MEGADGVCSTDVTNLLDLGALFPDDGASLDVGDGQANGNRGGVRVRGGLRLLLLRLWVGVVDRGDGGHKESADIAGDMSQAVVARGGAGWLLANGNGTGGSSGCM